MKHYCSTISVPLAEKLKEKGMKVEIVCDNTEEHSYPPEYHCETIFAEVFDWFAEQGYYISIHSAETPLGVGFYPSFNHQNFRSVNTLTRHEAAEKAIEKALELI